MTDIKGSTPGTKRSTRPLAIAMLVATAAFGVSIGAQQAGPAAPAGDLQVVPLRQNVFMLVGAGANVTVQTGDDGVLLVDSGSAAMVDKVLQAVRGLSTRPIRYILNTSADPDHTGGNARIAAQGVNLRTGSQNQFGDTGAEIAAHLAVMTRMMKAEGNRPARATADLPTSTFLTPQKDFHLNGEPVVIVHQPAAHSDGDTIVWFRRSDVISVGELFITTGYPVIRVESGGTVNGVLAALNEILKITVPERNQDGGTIVIPGRGYVSNENDVAEYRDMLTIIRDRVQDMVKKGMTLAQVQAARPTLDYDPLYGSDTGEWTTAKFVEAVYTSLARDR